MGDSLYAAPAGESGYLIDVPDADPAQIAHAVRAVAHRHRIALTDVVPGLCTVLVILAVPVPHRIFRGLLAEVEAEPPVVSEEAGVVTIDVCYDGPDLLEVAERTGLGVQQVIDLHTSTEFHAAFSGFAPGFVYLTGVPDGLRVPRRAEPRAALPGGSVALADRFTAVYPRSSPGGWMLIGTTAKVLWDVGQDPPAVIRPGMGVRFRAVA